MSILKVTLLLGLVVLVASDQLKFIKELGDDQLATKVNFMLDLLTHQQHTMQDLKETVDRQKTEIAQLQRTIDELKLERMGEGKVAMFRSCEEIRSSDPRAASGDYWIDPDGVGRGDPPISVYCDMTTGVTAVSHNSIGKFELDHCLDPGCYSRPIVYESTMRQMAALAQLSRSCRQFFKLDCYSVPFQFEEVQQAWWNDRNGNPQFYWTGSNDTVHTCQCGIDGNCVLPEVKCNCDTITPTDLSDAGYITNKDALPVTKLNFGRTLLQSTSSSHTLGQFECSGRVVPTGKPKSCEDLWVMGHSLSGYYDVQGTNEIRSVYCDFSLLPGEQGFQTAVGSVDIKSSPVYFHVQRTSFYNVAGATIPFEVESLNVGGGMNLSSGIFTAPRAGLYQFHFNGLKRNVPGLIRVALYHNDMYISDMAGPTSSDYGSFSFSSALKLNLNDKVRLVYNGPADLDDTPVYKHTDFVGILIQEDFHFE